MPRWKWFMRRGKTVDTTGPATCYPHRAGAHAPGDDDAGAIEANTAGGSEANAAAAADPTRPAWATEPTQPQPQTRPLLTPGQEHRSNDPDAPPRPPGAGT